MMDYAIRNEYGTRSRAAVFSELCRILLGEKHEFEEMATVSKKENVKEEKHAEV